MTWGRRMVAELALIAALGVGAGANAAERDDARALAAVLEAWGHTEHAGDLPGYEALLAPGFRSTVGPAGRGGTGRAGWLSAVRTRFEARARVSDDAPEIARIGAMAVARVGQVRGSGPGRESSQAWLWLVAGPDGWRVAGAEEARTPSRRGAAKTTPDALPLRLVVHAGAPHLLLATAEAEHLPDDPGTALAEVAEGWYAWPLADPVSDEAPTTWRGRSVVLHDADGPVCRGVADRLVVLVREPAPLGEAASPSAGLEVARTWSGAPGGGAAFLALRVSSEGRDPCRGATWAHLDDAPPERLPTREVSTEVRRAGLVALRKLPAYRVAGRLAEAEGQREGDRPRRAARRPRWELAPEARLELRGFGPAADGACYLAVSAEAPGQPWAGVAALWQVFGDGGASPHLVLISEADGPARPFVPAVALRIPGARDPAFVGGSRLLAPGGRWLREPFDASLPLYALPPRGGSTTSPASDTLGPRSTVPRSIGAQERARHVTNARSP